MSQEGDKYEGFPGVEIEQHQGDYIRRIVLPNSRLVSDAARATPVVNREDVIDDMREAFLVHWDNARAKLLGGDTSDMPRMIIEGALDAYHDEATASAEAKYLPVIEKLVGAAKPFATGNEGYDAHAEANLAEALALAAPLLRGK